MKESGFARLSAVPFEVHNTCAVRTEIDRAARIYDEIVNGTAAFPISFCIDGREQKGFAEFEPVAHAHASADSGRKLTDTLTFRHASGIEARAELAHYPDFAAFEWTVWFRNTGSVDSPRLSGVWSADVLIPGKAPRLSGITGDARNENYGDGVISPTYGMNNQPYDVPLALGQLYDLRPTGGCACNMEFPYFRLRTSEGMVLAAIGWPGQWRALFYADKSGIRFRAGQQILDTVLRPGEELRTPLTTFLLADGNDDDRLTNLWRRFMLECNMPRQHGSIMGPMLASTSITTGLMTAATEENQIAQIRNYRAHGIHPEMWWMDAGWYDKTTDGKPPACLDDYAFTGTWKMREKDFPTGMRAITDCMEEEQGQTMLWFEPERCGLPPESLKTDGTTLKPEWLLKGFFEIPRPRSFGIEMLPVRFVDLCNADARRWLTERICSVMRTAGISVYREDHNIRPLDFFTATDEPGRAGMTENKYITGHLEMWDEIRARFDGMIIDSCASGGRRNDLESMRRAVPLHYSDYFISSEATLTQRQAVISALYAYFPYIKAEGPSGNGSVGDDFDWYMNSSLTPFTMIHIAADCNEAAWERARAYVRRWKQVKRAFYADYYPLTGWNIDRGAWLAYEFIDSVTGEGAVFAFRRELNDDDKMTFRLKGLDPARKYAITDLMSGNTRQYRGSALSESGLTVSLPEPKSSTVLKIAPAAEG